MATIFRKTSKGAAEIETRALKLLPRFRSLLILVDGKRSDADLAQLVPGPAGQEALQALLAAGLIEAIGTTADTRSAAPAPPTTPAAPPAAAAASVSQRGRRIARALIDHLGPAGEPLAVRLESARDARDIEQLEAAALRLVGDMRGRAAAETFGQQLRQVN
jgi:hypothetical protein